MLLCCALALAPAGSAHGLCSGDVNRDGLVAVNELIQCVNVALGSLPLSPATDACDGNGDGAVAVSDLIAAVGSALGTCALPLPPDVEALQAATRVVITLPGTVEVLDFGLVGAPPGGALQTVRRPLGSPAAAAAGDAAVPCDTGGGAVACEGGGSMRGECRVAGGQAVLTESFAACERGDSSSGARVILDGTRIRTVSDPEFCQTCTVADGVADSIELRDFRSDLACGMDCPPGLRDALVSSPAASIARTPTGVAGELSMVISGRLRVENRVTGEVLDQTFAPGGLRMRAASVGDDAIQVQFLGGGVSVADCLGSVKFTSLDQEPITLRRDAKCPTGGQVGIALTDGFAAVGVAEGGSTTMAPAFLDAMAGAAAAAPAPASGFRDLAYRAYNGPVYQVLQNVGGDPSGAEDFRITTVVGSETEVYPCQTVPVVPERPQVVAALGIDPAAVDAVRTSGVIPGASLPCFAPRARNGAGQVCLGACDPATCSCSPGLPCVTFSLADQPPAITTALDAGRVNGGALVAPCNPDEYDTYAFGAALPTTALRRCSAEPGDGILLAGSSSAGADGAPGSTVIFAYDVPFGHGFASGAGAFGIDRDGANDAGCSPGEVVVPVRATSNPNLVPRVRFRGAAVQFNYNADAEIDAEVPACDDPQLLRCRVAPLATPTPDPGCRATDIGSTGTNAGPTTRNHVGGASCGGGGDRAPDVVLAYKVPESGFYVFDTAGSDFDTVLSVRAAAADPLSCNGVELACNDDRAAGAPTSQLGLLLAEGQHLLIVVDGFGTQGGNFRLTIRRTGDVGPTPTPTVDPGDADLPDLAVDSVSAAVRGSTVDVAAAVSNAGGAVDSFRLVFYFSTDAEITTADVDSGFGCIFGGLAAGAGAECRGPIDVPAGLGDGTYFVGAVVDPDDAVAERDEGNNALAAATPVRIDGAASTATPTTTPTRVVTTPPTSTRTATPSPTASHTRVPTATSSIASTATHTRTPADTATPLATDTAASTATRTATRTNTPVPTATLDLQFEPRAVAVQPGEEITIAVRLPTSRGSATVLDLSTRDAGIASVDPDQVVIPAGETTATLTVRGEGEGTTVVRAGGAANAAAGVYVTQAFAGSGTFVAPLVKIVVPTPQPTPQKAIVTGAIVAPLVRVAVPAPGATAAAGVASGAIVAPPVRLSVATPVPTAQKSSVAGAVVAPLVRLSVATPQPTPQSASVRGAIVAPLVAVNVDAASAPHFSQEVVP